MINAKIEQLKNLTLGQISEMTDQAKDLLQDLKYLRKKGNRIRNNTSVQEIIDSCDTKIKRPRFE